MTLSPAQRYFLMLARDGQVAVTARYRVTALALHERGLIDGRIGSVRATEAGRVVINEELRPRVHRDLSEAWAKGRGRRKVASE